MEKVAKNNYLVRYNKKKKQNVSEQRYGCSVHWPVMLQAKHSRNFSVLNVTVPPLAERITCQRYIHVKYPSTDVSQRGKKNIIVLTLNSAVK